MISEENAQRMARGENLIVDSEWVKSFPDDSGLFGNSVETIHIDLACHRRF